MSIPNGTSNHKLSEDHTGLDAEEHSQRSTSVGSESHPRELKVDEAFKSGPMLDVTAVDSTRENSYPKACSVPDGRPWRTTWLRIRPLSGLAALGLTVCCMFASLGILYASNNAPTATWKWQPSTYLAIMTAIANLAVRYACFQGLVVAWWSHASSGSTIRKLHQDWLAGTTFLGALSAGRHMGLLGLACMFATLVAIDGPLLQRASTVASESIVGVPVPLNTSLVAELPTAFSGGWALSPDGYVTTMFYLDVPTSYGQTNNNVISAASDDFNLYVRKPYLSGGQMTGAVFGCPGICRLKVQAPALAVKSCTTRKQPVNYNLPPPPLLDDVVMPLDRLGYLSYVNLLIDNGQERINVISGYAQTNDCVGDLQYTACTLDSAIGEYNITVKDNTITLDPESPTIVAIANNTALQNTTDLTGVTNLQKFPKSTLGGIVDLANAKWASLCAFPGGGTKKCQNFPGEKYQVPGDQLCTQWSDPMPDFLRDLNELMFRAGMYAAHTLTRSALENTVDENSVINATIVGHLGGDRNVFKTNFYYFLGAALLELFCILLVAPTYWGWWRLGRSVSLSPLEIAKAFDAPVLQNCDSNSSGRDVAKAVGDTRVRYGATSGMEAASINAVASPTSLRSPGDGEKICFADPKLVRRPTKSSIFTV